MEFENDDELLEAPEEDDTDKFRDEYDEDFVTVEQQVTGMIRIIVHSHDGYGVATERHVEMNEDTAVEFAEAVLNEAKKHGRRAKK